MSSAPPQDPVVVLGAGYAGLTVAQQVHRRSRGQLPIVLVDRHPVHVLRTELYEVGRLAREGGSTDAWTVPLARVFERSSVECREAAVEGIDLASRTVRLSTGPLRFGSLAVCLGSVAAYYGVPGAAGAHAPGVPTLGGAPARPDDPGRGAPFGHPAGRASPRFVIVGGGSTGTELAAEIATVGWAQVTGVEARPPDVLLLTGALPFLAGFRRLSSATPGRSWAERASVSCTG